MRAAHEGLVTPPDVLLGQYGTSQHVYVDLINLYDGLLLVLELAGGSFFLEIELTCQGYMIERKVFCRPISYDEPEGAGYVKKLHFIFFLK